MANLTLLDQMGKAQLDALGQLVGADFVGPTLRNYLREVPALPRGFTLGDAAVAYLEHRLGAMRKLVPATV